MRTNIDIADDVLDAAMRAGPFKTKKDAVEAGLRLLARQAACREILRWEGKLSWDGDDAGAPEGAHTSTAAVLSVQEPVPAGKAGASAVTASPGSRRHAGR